MKTSTKWILGVIIGLLIIAAIVTVCYVAVNRWHFTGWMMERRALQPWNDGRNAPWRDMPMHPNFRMPGQRIGGLMAFSVIGVIIRRAIPILILLALVILIFNLRRPVQSAPAQTPSQAAMPGPAGPTHPCPHCGRPAQEEWSHCPYCGTELTSS
jgi:uncharacterized membrane protein